MEAILLLPGQGEQIATGASTTVMKATAATTGGAFSMSEVTFPAGMAGPPPHAHHHTTDTFYVLEGILHLLVGTEEIDAPAGSYILVPPGAVHTFANFSDAPVRFLNFNIPGGWEAYMRDLAAAAASGTPPTREEIGKIAGRYDFRPA